MCMSRQLQVGACLFRLFKLVWLMVEQDNGQPHVDTVMFDVLQSQNTEGHDLDVFSINEYMHGWGLEDTEKLKRITILGLLVYRVRGGLYHFWHPRGNNSGYFDPQREMALLKEYGKVCMCPREELLVYIKSWKTGHMGSFCLV